MRLVENEKYIDSGIDWLRDIPVDWQVLRLKDISDIKTGSKNTEDNVIDGEYPFFVRSQTIERINTFSFDGEAILTAGDGVGVAKVFHHYTGKFDYHQRVYRISHFKGVYGRFLYYYMSENLYKDVLRLNAKSTVDSLRLPMFKNFAVVLPSVDKQQKIADYLDKKTAQIDKKVELLEQKIAYYMELRKSIVNETVCRGLDKNVALKDSGIEWMGKIPEHWEVKRMKETVTHLETGNRDKGGALDNGVVSISAEHISWNGAFKFDSLKYISNELYNKMNNGKIKLNDILLTKDGATIGKTAIVEKMYFDKMAINEHMYIIRTTLVPKLLYYILITVGLQQIQKTTKNSAIPGINSSFLSNVFIALPKARNEQEAIVEYLNKKTLVIDKVAKNMLQQIEVLRELRKTLINDVVTGKLKVN